MNKPRNFSDFFALTMTKFFRFIADTFFAKRYGHRAVVLETIAGVPGMVAGMLIHLRSLRKMQTGYGSQIREMLAEAENERMHLMFFIEIAKPNAFERFLVIAAQAIFMAFYLFMYICFPKTSHRMIGYFEDEAVKSYTEYLDLVENGTVMNIRAPRIAIEYYNLKKDARLSDLIISVRADEMHHAEVNHDYANDVQSKSSKKEMNDDLKKEVA
jgi:ubiquinol oxidase|tara:strand:+ start:3097 stop:3738 length:642 start_codon:yes stop_codon:yes gene_type:complete